MASDNKIKYLEEQLEQQIQSFGQGRHSNKKKAFGYRLAIISCSFFTTILIGMHNVAASIQPLVRDIALIFSALVTALGAIDAFYDHRALWIRYTATTNELKTLRSKLHYLMADGAEPVENSRVDELFEEFHRILAETNSEWLQLRKQTESKTQKA